MRRLSTDESAPLLPHPQHPQHQPPPPQPPPQPPPILRPPEVIVSASLPTPSSPPTPSRRNRKRGASIAHRCPTPGRRAAADDGTPPQPPQPIAPIENGGGGVSGDGSGVGGGGGFVPRGDPAYAFLGISDQRPIVRVTSSKTFFDRLGVPRRRSSGLSPIRRLFVYVVAFDLIVTFVLWVVYLALLPGSLVSNLRSQILDYSVKTSLFDCVCCSLFRFLLLQLGYSFLQLRHWWLCLVTMVISTLFAVAKCFESLGKLRLVGGGGGDEAVEPTMAKYLVILSGMVFAWSEVCLLDFKVLPTERYADFDVARRQPVPVDAAASPPGVPDDAVRAASRRRRRGDANVGANIDDSSSASSNASSEASGWSAWTKSGDERFHTPVESEEEAEEGAAGKEASSSSSESSRTKSRAKSLYLSAIAEAHLRSPSTISSTSLSPLEMDWIRQARRNMEVVVAMFDDDDDNWKKEKSGDVKHFSQNHPVHGKLFKCSAEIPGRPELVLREVVLKDISEMVVWSSQISDGFKLQQLDDVTAVTWSATPQQGGGVISPRDYVDLTYWAKRGDAFYSCTKGVSHPSAPPTARFVRGVNGPSGLRLSRSRDFSATTTFEWIVNTSIGGWIPQRFVDAAISGIQDDFVRDLLRHLDDIQTFNSV